MANIWILVFKSYYHEVRCFFFKFSGVNNANINEVAFSSLVAIKEFRVKTWWYVVELKEQPLRFALLVTF